jgi:hypothetical protein
MGVDEAKLVQTLEPIKSNEHKFIRRFREKDGDA